MRRRVWLVVVPVVLAVGCVLLMPALLRPAGRPRALTVVALGDSVPAGAACLCRPYPALVGRALGPDVRTVNLARNGQTTAGLLAQLDEPQTRARVRGAGAVLLTVGANDFDETIADDERCTDPRDCVATELAELSPSLQRVLGRLHALLAPATPVVVTGYWNVFRDGAVAAAHGPGYVASSTALTRLVDQELAAAAEAGGAHFVDVAAAFASSGDVTRLLATDGDHPNARGHRVIAGAVVPVLRHALAGASPAAGTAR